MAVIRKIFITCLVLSALAAFAAERNPLNYKMTKSIEFSRPYHPYFATNWPAVSRVHLDLSLDGGSNWTHRIAHGLPAAWGTNTYNWTFNLTPDLWTEHARIAVRTLWGSTSDSIPEWEGAMSPSEFKICGIRCLAPTNNEVILQPSYYQLQWHEAGPDYVDIGVSTNAGVTWEKIITVASTSPTNSYSLPIINMPTGRVDFIVVAYSNLYDKVTVEIRNQ